MAFLLTELGTDGSLDGQSRLIVKGRFAPKNFEGILRRYISECSRHLRISIEGTVSTFCGGTSVSVANMSRSLRIRV